MPNAHTTINDATDCLLIVDVQNDFCHNGALQVPHAEQVIPVINVISAIFAHRILTQDWHPQNHGSFATSHPGKSPFEMVTMSYGEQVLWPDHCVQGSIGAQFHADLDVIGAELIIRKGFRREIDSYSAFYENDQSTPTGLSGYLRNRGFKRVFITGLATDFCVRYSAIDARREGFEVFLIADGCRAIDRDNSLADALDAMEVAGVEMIDSGNVG